MSNKFLSYGQLYGGSIVRVWLILSFFKECRILWWISLILLKLDFRHFRKSLDSPYCGARAALLKAKYFWSFSWMPGLFTRSLHSGLSEHQCFNVSLLESLISSLSPRNCSLQASLSLALCIHSLLFGLRVQRTLIEILGDLPLYNSILLVPYSHKFQLPQQPQTPYCILHPGLSLLSNRFLLLVWMESVLVWKVPSGRELGECGPHRIPSLEDQSPVLLVIQCLGTASSYILFYMYLQWEDDCDPHYSITARIKGVYLWIFTSVISKFWSLLLFLAL